MKNGRFLTFTAIAAALMATPAAAQPETFAWGQNNHGQTNVVQVPVFGLSYDQVSAGREHSAVVRNDGLIIVESSFWTNMKRLGQRDGPMMDS